MNSEPIYAPEPPPDWRDHLSAVADECGDANGLYRDDADVEFKLRMECIERALESLLAARTALTLDHGRLAIARAMAKMYPTTDQGRAEMLLAMAGAGCTLESMRAESGRAS